MLNVEDLKNISTEKLREIVAEKKKTLADIVSVIKKEKKEVPIDRFADISTLLYENILAQKETNVQLRKLIELYQREVPTIERYGILVHLLQNVVIIGKKTVFEGNFAGIINEISFRSVSSVPANGIFSIRVTADENIPYADSYTNFAARHKYETDMTAFDDDDFYIVQFQNIAFNKSILIEVYDSTATFSRIYMKYHKEMVI